MKVDFIFIKHILLHIHCYSLPLILNLTLQNVMIIANMNEDTYFKSLSFFH